MKQRLEEFAISDDTSLNKLANRIFEEWEQRQPPPSISYKQEGKQGEIDERQIQGNNGVQGIQA